MFASGSAAASRGENFRQLRYYSVSLRRLHLQLGMANSIRTSNFNKETSLNLFLK